MSPSEKLVKFTPPQVGNLYISARLVAQLSSSLSKPITWISAQAGSGKTQLVSHFVTRQKQPILWYQLDASDSDPASFFYYLAKAAISSSRKRKIQPYPLFTPEYTFGLNSFCRHFFQKIADDLPDSSIIVFDDYHHLDPCSPLHEAIASALTTLQDSLRCILISRTNPPPSFADLHLKKRLSLLNNDTIKLTPIEVGEFLEYFDVDHTTADIDNLYRQTNGWIAGISLLSEVLHSKKNLPTTNTLLSTDSLYNYFKHIQDTIPIKNIKHFLYATCLLPRFTLDIAALVSGTKESREIIDYLVNNNYFISRYFSHTIYYQYHPLFSEFLIQEALQVLDVDEIRRIQTVSAQHLLDCGMYEDSADLLIKAQSWSQLETLVLSHADQLLRQGRSEQLKHWISSLPLECVHNNPWLRYWFGLSHFPFDMPSSRHHLIESLYMFVNINDKDGAYLSWSKIIDTYVNALIGFNELDEWLDYFHLHLQKLGPYEHEPYAEYIANSMFTALNLIRLGDAEISYWQRLSYDLCHNSQDYNLRVNNLFQQCLYVAFHGLSHTFDGLLHQIAHTLDDQSITPFHVLQLSLAKSFLSHLTLNHAEVYALYKDGLLLGKEHSIHNFDAHFLINAIASALFANDITTAKNLHNEYQPLSPKLLPWDEEISAHIHARLLLAENNLNSAWKFSQLDVKLAHSIGYKPPIIFSSIVASQILSSMGRYEEARDYINHALSIANEVHSELYLYLSFSQLAYLELKTGNVSKGKEYLALSLNIASIYSYVSFYTWLEAIDVFLYAKALEYSIEKDFVLTTISRLNLPNNRVPYYLESWPWPVKIYTLRKSLIIKDGNNIDFSSTSNNRPLELLRAIIALGGNSISEVSLCDLLWPDSEADAASRSLTTTIHRLRKLLGKEIVTVTSHRLSINKAICWVDSDALYHVLNTTIDGINTDTMTIHDVVSYSRIVLTLAPESPFTLVDSTGWIISYYERLRSRLSTFITKSSSFLTVHNDADLALQLYQLGISLDPLAESFYQGAIELLITEERYSEATRLYYQCAAELHRGLGISPSPETNKLYAKAHALAEGYSSQQSFTSNKPG